MTPRRVVFVTTLCALVIYLGALANRFAMDDLYIIVYNPLVTRPATPWAIFTSPYWPPAFGGQLYRPLTVLTFALDRLIDGPLWFHAVNLVWHAMVTGVVATLVTAWAGPTVGLLGGLLFAVHPVHVEAVANVVGRAELMAALFAILAVAAALHPRRSPWWSAAAFAAGLLCKENAVVVPALVAWAWLLGIRRPPRRRMLTFAAAWLVAAAGWAVTRAAVLAPYARFRGIAPAFLGVSALDVRWTAVAALTDVARLLVFPLTLRADYSPAERVALTTPADVRFVAGAALALVWVALIAAAWRRGRTVEAFGLGWAAIAFSPVANLVVPVGVVVAERTLYLPSMGVVVAAAAWAARTLPRRALVLGATVVVLAGALRTALRVPVWRDDIAVTESILDDSPRSYRGPARSGGLLASARRPERALAAFRRATEIYDRDAQVWLAAGDAALTLGERALADSLLVRADALCGRCTGLYQFQATAARTRGDTATARALLAHAAQWEEAAP